MALEDSGGQFPTAVPFAALRLADRAIVTVPAEMTSDMGGAAAVNQEKTIGSLTVEDRATIANMAPEYGATCGIVPIDQETIRYLTFTSRDPERVALVEAYAKAQGMWHDPSAEPRYSERVELDLSTIVPSLAGPKRPQDRVPLSDAKAMFRTALGDYATTAPMETFMASHNDRHPTDLAGLHEGVIIVSKDLTPSLVMQLESRTVLGIATVRAVAT